MGKHGVSLQDPVAAALEQGVAETTPGPTSREIGFSIFFWSNDLPGFAYIR